MGDAAPPAPLIETVVTTIGPDGRVNCAAMGVRLGDPDLVFWPFDATRTLRNLRGHGEAVVHLTGDVLLFAQAALGDPRPGVRPADVVRGAIIEGAGAYREVAVTDIRPAPGPTPRSEVRARVVAAGSSAGEAPGLCRARHAVVEASILASRIALLDRDAVRGELDRLQVLVEKTAGPREREAMDYVRRHVEQRA